MCLGCACAPQQVNIGVHDAGAARPVHELTGRYCTARPDVNGFSTRIFVMIENGLAQCAIDAQAGVDGGACPITPIAGATVAARGRLLERLFDQADRSATFSVMWFGSNSARYPATGTTARLDPTLRALPASLANQTDGLSDYESALTATARAIREDVQSMQLRVPEQLPRTKYVVLLVGSGLPQRRCAAPGVVTSDAPGIDGTWPSFDDAACASVGALNQPSALVKTIASLRAAVESVNSSLTVNAVQLFDEAALSSCGAACASLQPWQPRPGDRAWTVKEQLDTGHALLTSLATTGGGAVMQATSAAQLNSVSIPSSFIESAISANVLKALLLVPLTSTFGPLEPRLDSDGDGVPDDDERGFELTADRDGDCFSDGLELRLATTHGFDVATDDPRGCDPLSPLTRNCVCRDSDGDRASTFEEGYFLPALQVLVDSDADGVPDGVELAAGLNPDVALPASRDTDNDGVPDAAEVVAMTNPLVADRAYADTFGITRNITQALEQRTDSTICYDFTFRQLPLLQAPGLGNTNRFLIYAADAPQAVAAKDFGRWRV